MLKRRMIEENDINKENKFINYLYINLKENSEISPSAILAVNKTDDLCVTFCFYINILFVCLYLFKSSFFNVSIIFSSAFYYFKYAFLSFCTRYILFPSFNIVILFAFSYLILIIAF